MRIPYSRWVTGINSPHLVLVDGIPHHVKHFCSFPGVRVPFRITSKLSKKDKQLSRPRSVSPNDTSDTSVLEATDDDVDGLPDDGLGPDWTKEEATAPHSKGAPEQRGPHPAAHFVMRTSGASVIENRGLMAAMNGNYYILEERGVDFVLPA